MKEYHKALESYKKGLHIDADSQLCKQGPARMRAGLVFLFFVVSSSSTPHCQPTTWGTNALLPVQLAHLQLQDDEEEG